MYVGINVNRFDFVDAMRNERWNDIYDFLLFDDIGIFTAQDIFLISLHFSYKGKLELLKNIAPYFSIPLTNRYNGDINIPFSSYLEPGTNIVGQTILGFVWGGNDTIETLSFLLQKNKNLSNSITFSGYTSLQLAIVFNAKEHAKMLLEHGANPNSSSQDHDRLSAFDLLSGKVWALKLLNEFGY